MGISIDREEVIKGLERCTSDLSCTKCPYHEEEYCRRALKQDALELLKEQKTIVRCKDCKFWDAGLCLNDNVSWQIQDCGCYPNFITDSNWFCAEGERR